MQETGTGASTVKELVLVLIERMRVLDLSVTEIKINVQSKSDVEKVKELENKMDEIRIIVNEIKQKQDNELLLAEELEKQRGMKDAKTKAFLNIVYWIAGIGSILFFLAKSLLGF